MCDNKLHFKFHHSIQYRMHPEISSLPSRLFYDNRLHDGPDMAVKTQQPWHTHPKFGTYKFFNVRGTEEQSSRSLINKTECQVASALYARLRREFSSVNLDFRVGVVSMYRAQVMELRRHFERYLGERLEGKVDFNTVDGFQGQEKDIIILSCVRGGVNQDSVGFLAGMQQTTVVGANLTGHFPRRASDERSANACKVIPIHLGQCSHPRTEQDNLGRNNS